MCGISGLANLAQDVSLEGYYSAHLRLRHRGQDDEGFFLVQQGEGLYYRGDDTVPDLAHLPHIGEASGASVVLGHRRLSIIDLSPTGHQPISDSSGRYSMVYNGEIFNYIELRQELEALGYRFLGQSDAEVLLEAFAEWGTACFNRLNGMWAAVIWDSVEGILFLSRDRFGIKPLYYSLIRGTFYFGSEAKFILPFLPELSLNEARATEYLVQSVLDHDSETMFAGVHQLPPAHYAVLDRAGFRQYLYWQVPEGERKITLEQARDELGSLLSSAVALRLRSDVPVGSLLSGGLDSTTIVCLVRQILDQAGAQNTFQYFSAIFEEEAFSEQRYIEETVARIGGNVHWIYPKPETLFATLPRLLYFQEFPFRSLAVYSQWEIMRHVRQTPIVVLLNGQGSDELFAGYTAHYHALAAEYLRRWKPYRAQRELQALIRARQLQAIPAIAGVLRELVKASPLRALTRYRRVPYLNRTYGSAQGWNRQQDIFRDALVRNLTFSALPEYLRYEDRNSMAFTLESRLPFMDHRLVEWAMSLPAEVKIAGIRSKYVLREMARPLIPPSIFARTDKMGFVSPQERWQRGVLRSAIDAVFDKDLGARFPFLNVSKTREIYQAYRNGVSDNWAWVWRITCLYEWHRVWWEGQDAR